MFFFNNPETEFFNVSNNNIYLCTNFNNCNGFIIKETRKKGENKEFCDICLSLLSEIKPKDRKILKQIKLTEI